MRIVESQIVNGRPQRLDEKQYYKNEFVTEEHTCISQYTGSMTEAELPTYTGPYPPHNMRKKARYSRYRFMEKLGDAAMLQIVQSTDPVIMLMLKKLEASKYIDMKEQAAIDAVDYLIANGIIDASDRDSIVYTF